MISIHLLISIRGEIRHFRNRIFPTKQTFTLTLYRLNINLLNPKILSMYIRKGKVSQISYTFPLPISYLESIVYIKSKYAAIPKGSAGW